MQLSKNLAKNFEWLKGGNTWLALFASTGILVGIPIRPKVTLRGLVVLLGYRSSFGCNRRVFSLNKAWKPIEGLISNYGEKGPSR